MYTGVVGRSFNVSAAARTKLAQIMQDDPSAGGAILAKIVSIRDGALPVPVDCKEYPVHVEGTDYSLIVTACRDYQRRMIDVEITDIQ